MPAAFHNVEARIGQPHSQDMPVRHRHDRVFISHDHQRWHFQEADEWQTGPADKGEELVEIAPRLWRQEIVDVAPDFSIHGIAIKRAETFNDVFSTYDLEG